MLKLPVPVFPREVKLRMDVQPVELGSNQHALCIHGAIDRLTAPAMQQGGKIAGELVGQYRTVLVYSPKDHQLYQAGSLFAAAYVGGQVRIGTTSMAVDKNGKPLTVLLDLRKELGLAPSKPITAHSGVFPLAVAQGLKLQQVAAAVTMTAAERATNPAIPTLLGDILFLDGEAGYLGASPLETWCTEYGQAQGGEVGKLAAKYLYNVTTTGLGEVLPATLAFPPLVAPVATAYALYQVYDSMADLGGAVLAAKISESLRPFDWSQPTLSQANRAFPTDAITKTAPNWDGAATSTHPVQTAGSRPMATPHVTSPTGVQSMPSGNPWSVAQPAAPPSGPGTTPSLPTWQPTHGKALGQLEQLAGQRIEEVPVPDVGSGTPVETTTPGTPEQIQQPPGQQMNGSQGGQANTSGVNTQTTGTPQPGTYTATETPSSMTETTSTPTQSGTPSASGYGDRAPQYTDVAQSTPNTSADAINNMFNNAGAIEQGGAGLSQGAPIKNPPPTPQSGSAIAAKVPAPASSGVDPVLVGLGVGGAVVGAVAIAAVAGKAAEEASYHCNGGYSWCPDVGKCCPTHWISAGNIPGGWGAYYIQGHGCYGSAQSAADAAAHGYGFPYPCVDERKNK